MIKIYPSLGDAQEPGEIEYSGSLIDLLKENGFAGSETHLHQTQVFKNGELIPVSAFDACHIELTDDVEIRVSPLGGIGKIFGKVFNLFFGWLMPKQSMARQFDYGQSKQISAAEGKANTARLNEVIPEQFGRMVHYPSYLVPPRRRFIEPKKQQLDLLVCQKGEFDIHSIEIGNTLASVLPGAQVTIYQPGADLSGEPCAENWYSAPEVGGTSAGTAGLELTAITSESTTPSGSSFTFSAKTITSDTDFPRAWGAGTRFSVQITQQVTLSPEAIDLEEYTGFTGNWSGLYLSIGTRVLCSGAFNGEALVAAISGDKVLLDQETESGLAPVRLPVSTGTAFMSISIVNRLYEVVDVFGDAATVGVVGAPSWGGWISPITAAAALTSWSVDSSTVYGEVAGPFVICQKNERTNQIEIDLFFPQGLFGEELSNRTVRVDISYRDAATSGTWTTVRKTYTQKTVDQIGFTESITLPGMWLPEVRLQRIGARTSSGNAQDNVQWYAARSRLEQKNSYPELTAIAIKILGLGQISASSENQVKVTSTRKLNGVATRKISDAFRYIVQDAGYPLTVIDNAALTHLENTYWTPRGETFDAVLQNGTVQQALENVMAAGMAEFTTHDGYLVPVREGIRTISDHKPLIFSAQTNTEFSRSFTSPKPDDHDGVEVEFQDEAMGFVANTVVCTLPGSIGAKLQKVKLVGVTDKTRAYRIGMRRAGEQRYRRWQYSWGTELDLMNAAYGDYVLLCPEIPGMGQSSLIDSYANGVLYASEELTWVSGQNHLFAYKAKDGTIIGPFSAIKGDDNNQIITSSAPPAMREVSIVFGTASRFSFEAIVSKITPNDDMRVKASGFNYDARIYQYDNATAPE